VMNTPYRSIRPSRFLAECIAAALLLASAPAGGQTPVRHDCWILTGGDSLDATYYVPSVPPEDSTGYPGMLFVHGFGESKDADTLDALFQAQNGYLSLCYSVRGQGNSSGGTTIMGSTERRDLAYVLSYMRSIPGIDSGRIGIQGGSQGGLHVLWAVADSLPCAAGVADVIAPHWASDMLANGSVRTTLTFLLQTEGVRYAPVRDSLWALLRSDDFRALREMFVTSRDVDTARLHRSGIPLATSVKWQDHYFAAEDGLESYLRQHEPKRIYLGTGGHYSDNVLSELEYQWDIIGAWMEQFVRGRESGILSRPPVTFAYSSLPMLDSNNFSWTHLELAVWPPPGIRTVRLFLNADSSLTPEMPALENSLKVLRNNWSGRYPLDSGYVDGFEGTRFNRNLPRESLAFTGAPLSSDAFWIGTPLMHLYCSSFYDKFPLHAQIFEVEEGGAEHFINRITFTARDWTPGAAGSVEIPGAMHAHLFRKGNRIRVELTNIDDQSKFQWEHVPFTVPMFAVSSVAVFMDASRPSYIDLPLLGDPGIPNAILAFSADYDRASHTVLLSWQTPAEWNNAGFVVERSSDGTSGFVQLDNVAPKTGPTSPLPSHYVYQDSALPLGCWWYRIRQRDLTGTEHLSRIVAADVIAGVDADAVPRVMMLAQNYPNPLNPTTEIAYEIPEAADVRLRVYDLLGREVAALVNEPQAAGRHTVRFDASRLASGTYLYRLQVGTRAVTRRMMVLK
jgi:predicted acyl esterase